MTVHGKLMFTASYTRTCVICERTFQTRIKNQLTCSERCRKDRQAHLRRWKRKKREMDAKRELLKEYERGKDVSNIQTACEAL